MHFQNGSKDLRVRPAVIFNRKGDRCERRGSAGLANCKGKLGVRRERGKGGRYAFFWRLWLMPVHVQGRLKKRRKA